MDGYSTIDLKTSHAVRTQKDSNNSGLANQSGLVMQAIILVWTSNHGLANSTRRFFRASSRADWFVLVGSIQAVARPVLKLAVACSTPAMRDKMS